MPDPAFELREAVSIGLRTGRWRAGERLPTERTLCEQFGAGRSVVRRVLRELKAAGLITQRVGSGTFVVDDIAQRLARSDGQAAGVGPAELMQARLVLEPALLELVVRNATAADFADMENFCRQAEQATSLQQFEHWDARLHQRIAEATHNGLCVQVLRLIDDAREHGQWGLLKRRSVTPERREAYQREHRALVAALKNRDVETARNQLLAHLQHVQRNLFER